MHISLKMYNEKEQVAYAKRTLCIILVLSKKQNGYSKQNFDWWHENKNKIYFFLLIYYQTYLLVDLMYYSTL